MKDTSDKNDRFTTINNLTKKLNNGWEMTVHYKNKTWNTKELADTNWKTEEEFLNYWEKDKPVHLEEFAAFINDFGISALISCTNTKTRIDKKYDEPTIWFMSSKTAEDICFVNDINIWPSKKFIEVFINA